MSSEIALFRPPEALPEAPALPQAHSDDQLVAIWLHGRSTHTQRAYRADVARFRRGAMFSRVPPGEKIDSHRWVTVRFEYVQ